MIRDDVKKILCDGVVIAYASACETIRSDPKFDGLPEEVRAEFLKRCIVADEAYIKETGDAINWLMDQKP
jgi:hypothetical protein